MAGERGGHGDVTGEDGGEAADPLAVAGVDLVRHGGGADLALLETLGKQALAGHEAQGGGEARRAGAELVKSGHDLEVERARIHLADRAEGAAKAEMLDDAGLKLGNLGRVPVEEGELVELGADGALQAAHRVTRRELGNTGVRGEYFFTEHRETLAQRGRLGGHVVGAAGEHEVAVGLGARGELVERRGGFHADDCKRAGDLELLDVFREIAGGETEVNALVAGEGVEGLDAGLHVVERDALAGIDVCEVDVVLNLLVGGDGLRRDGEAELALGLHDRDPVVALDGDPAGGGPDVFDQRGGVAVGEDVGNRHGEKRSPHGGVRDAKAKITRSQPGRGPDGTVKPDTSRPARA